MEFMTYSQARAHLASTMDKVVRKQKPIVIIRRGHSPVAMVPIDALNGEWDETAYLMSTKANRLALKRSLKQLEEGKTIQVKWSKAKQTYVPI